MQRLNDLQQKWNPLESGCILPHEHLQIIHNDLVAGCFAQIVGGLTRNYHWCDVARHFHSLANRAFAPVWLIRLLRIVGLVETVAASTQAQHRSGLRIFARPAFDNRLNSPIFISTPTKSGSGDQPIVGVFLGLALPATTAPTLESRQHAIRPPDMLAAGMAGMVSRALPGVGACRQWNRDSLKA